MAVIAHDVTARDGLTLRLWEHESEAVEEAVLFVHGATYSGRAAFAPSETGRFWLDATAEAGRGAFAVDLRGYGHSERPVSPDAALDEPPVRAPQAADDVADALAFVRERFGRVHLVGYSWGTVICGVLLTRSDAPAVASLTQFAPVYRMPADRADEFDPGDPPQPYRTVTKAGARERWDDQAPGGVSPTALRGGDVGNGDDDGDGDGDDGDAVFEAFWTALVESGQGEDTEEGTIVAPNGTLVDLQDSTEAPVYAAGAITTPALVIRGSWDPTSTRSDALGLYDDLGATGNRKEYIEIAGGTHFLPLERRRGALYDAVRAFQRRA